MNPGFLGQSVATIYNDGIAFADALKNLGMAPTLYPNLYRDRFRLIVGHTINLRLTGIIGIDRLHRNQEAGFILFEWQHNGQVLAQVKVSLGVL